MPTVEEALQIGWKKHQTGDLRGAEHIYRQVLAVAPANENAWCFLGIACHDQGRFDEAVEAYRQALHLKPRFPVALSNLGNTLKQLGRLDDAEASCREALRCKPDYSTAYNNLGVVLVAQGRLTEAASTFEQALKLMPNDAVAHANLGAALVRQGRFDEGTANAQQALKINPHYADAHKNQAIVSLLLGDFERGWPEYEWRWRCAGSSLPQLRQPRWTGEPLEGRTILLHWEQGLGDTIQFVRYARIFKRQGAQVVVTCQKPLYRLLQRGEGIDHLVVHGEPLPDFDFWTPMMSVPGVLRTTLDTIPSECGYITAAPELVARWAARLQEYPGCRIAIAWQGSPDFHADRQRSVPLAFFAELAKIPNIRLISLQKGPGTEQLKQLGGQFEVIQFDDLDSTSGPFMDSAAIMRNVDLVVSSDTSLPHLAGALGVPVWMALSVSPDWRWLLEREDSPWYPSMRIFRQRTLGSWEDVFQRIAAALAERGNVEVRATAPANSAASDVTVEPSRPAAAVLQTGFNALVSARHGFMLFNRNDAYIGRSLEIYGEFSEEELQLLSRYIRSGDTIVEAGANIGTHTVPLARAIGPAGRVFAFEPQRLVFQTLCANIAINSLSNVYSRQQALGSKAGELVVPQLNPEAATNFGGLELGTYNRGERVPVVTIDSLALAACRLIKIDVEGMEREVLLGAAETIQRCQPVLYVENDRDERSPALIEHLLALGYRLYWHVPLLFRPDNYFGNRENVFGRIASINMLGLHSASDLRVDGLRPITEPGSNWRDG